MRTISRLSPESRRTGTAASRTSDAFQDEPPSVGSTRQRARRAAGPSATCRPAAAKDLFDLGDRIETVYFPTDAVVSLVVPLSTAEVVETAVVGCDGVIGAAGALNGRRSLNRAIVQIAGHCLVCAIEPLRKLLQEYPNMRSLIGADDQALFARAQQSAASNATDVIESRFARWPLRAADLHGNNELPLLKNTSPRCSAYDARALL